MALQCIQIDSADPDQRARFDRFVESSEKGNFSQLCAWGDVKERTGWRALRLLVSDGASDRAAMSILKRPIPFTGRAIFYAPRAPVAAVRDTEAMDALFRGAEALAMREKAILLKIDPDVERSDQAYQAFLEDRGFSRVGDGDGFEGAQPRFVFRLDIRPDLETLFANLHGKTRYNVRYARRKGVVVRRMTDPAELDTFYDILSVTAERDGFLVRGREYFRWIFEAMVPSGHAVFYLAEHEGQAIAGTLAMYCGDKCWYLYGASSNQKRKLMPNYLLQWTMIEEAKERGCTLYDFRGVSGDLSPDNPLYGLYRFKKGFNGTLTEYVGEYDRSYQPGWVRAYRALEPLYRKATRALASLRKSLGR